MGAWSSRAPKAVALIQSAAPDVIAFQEGGGWVGPESDKVRQVDDIRRRLGSDYQLVRTEIPPTEPHYFRTGSYIMIKKSALSVVGASDHWDIGGAARVGAYAELRTVDTGARFLFVATHLTSGSDQDAEREAEITTLLTRAKAEAASRGGVPIVIGGDFNSHPTADEPNDPVTVVTRDAGFADAITTAQTINDTQYNSSNQYLRTPPASGVSVDHIFSSPGVAVVGFRVVVKLVNGKFSGVIPSDHNPLIAAVSIPY
jgi:endonuclease/exonuclease/phosphatase family metal-dependent hydrolase